MAEENKNNEESETTENTDSNLNQNQENTEEEEEKEEDDKDTFTPHKGRVMQIKPYKYFKSVDFDKSYSDPTGSGKVVLPYDTSNISDLAVTNKDLKYIYKGVSCKVKLRRSSDEPFTPTGIEEVKDVGGNYGYLSEEEIQEREHIPTEEQLTELGLDEDYSNITYGNNTESTRNQDSDNVEQNKREGNEDVRYTRSAHDDAIFGFLSDVSLNSDGIELEIKDYGYLLERDDIKLNFNGLHSLIFEEVIKSYGLIPDVDFTGLPDDNIVWSNVTSSGGDSKNSDNGSFNVNGDGSLTEQQVWDIQNSWGYGGSCSSHDPEEAWKMLGTKKGLSPDCYGCTAWLYYVYNFKVGIPARDICYHSSSASSGSHHTIQIYKNGEWVDPEQYRGGHKYLGVISGHATHVCREPPNNGKIPEYVRCPYSNNG